MLNAYPFGAQGLGVGTTESMRSGGGGSVEVSIIVPAFNEAGRLPRSLPALVAALRAAPWSSEVIVVDDGSTDATAAIAEDLLADIPDVRVVRLPWNCGKGTAVRVGVTIASGRKVAFADADMASDIASLPRLISLLDEADVAVGSRIVAGATVDGRSFARTAAAATFRRLVLQVTPGEVRDTQCGFKAFRTPVAKLLFSSTTSEGFGFDVEILSLAGALGLRIAQCPVNWTAVDGSHVSLRRHVPGMLRDLRRARRHQVRGRTVPVLSSPFFIPLTTPLSRDAAREAEGRVVYLDAPSAGVPAAP